MGIRGACDGTLGIAPVTRTQTALKASAVIALPVLLAGCTTIGSVAGAVTGAVSGSASANPAVGYAVGIGTKAAVDAVAQYIARSRQRAEQDQIAAVVGALPVGERAAWQIRHKIPLGNQHGYVTVVRDIPNALARCKEVVFTVVAGKKVDSPRGYYATTACEQGTRWKWAQAEPATPRWGFLQ
jgi:hypothetical protein